MGLKNDIKVLQKPGGNSSFKIGWDSNDDNEAQNKPKTSNRRDPNYTVPHNQGSNPDQKNV